MKLSTIELNNFKCFYGMQKINLEVQPPNRVVIINAENGAGKTVLTQAFLWALHAEEKELKIDKNSDAGTALFCYKEIYSLLPDETAEMSVKLIFSHDNSNFTLLRKWVAIRKGDAYKIGHTELHIDVIGKNGTCVTHDQEQAQQVIDGLAPSAITKLLFFKGEKELHFEQLPDQLDSSISSIMGITPYERGIAVSYTHLTLPTTPYV